MHDLRILIVDDEEAMRESLAAWLEKGGGQVTRAAGGVEALELLSQAEYDLVLLDIKMPGLDGHELLRRIRENDSRIMIVMVTAYGSIESAVRAMKEGANDYLLKPFDPEHLVLLIEKMAAQKAMMDEYYTVRARLSELESAGFGEMIGCSEAMRKVFGAVEEAAPTETPLLITGETGTGKELVARAVHSRSGRDHGPFVAINCGALPEHLLESELFGHERGAFTGAIKTRLGRVEMADQGTLFLDEVGDITPQMQISLLRAVEEKRFVRLGGNREVESDFRLISATHRDMEALVDQGLVRSDFYFRINVISISIPPLRQRREDIPLLAEHFVLRFSQEMVKPVDGLTRSALELLKRYKWPGNVRELRNVIERAVVVCRGSTITAEDLTFRPGAKEQDHPSGESLEDVEIRHIQRILEKNDWNISRTASRLGLNRGTLSRKIKKHGLVRPG